MSSLQEQVQQLTQELSPLQISLQNSNVIPHQHVYISDRQYRVFAHHPCNDNDPQLDDWIDSMDRATRGFTPQQATDFMLDHLRDEAYQEVRLRVMDNCTPKEVCDILQDIWGDGQYSTAQIERQFYNRLQRPGETLLQYSHALMMMASKTATVTIIFCLNCDMGSVSLTMIITVVPMINSSQKSVGFHFLTNRL